ncbi:MAG: hypothetical protein K0R44_3220 [Thermomicrobiales bacterium]|nr:hypothetical protein [Thermomicrobiales bacterium]
MSAIEQAICSEVDRFHRGGICQAAQDDVRGLHYGAWALHPNRSAFEQIDGLVLGAVPDDCRKPGLQDVRGNGVPHPA